MASMRRGGKRGQSIFELMLLITVVLAAIAVGMGTIIKPGVNKTMTDSKDIMEGASGNLKTKLLGK